MHLKKSQIIQQTTVATILSTAMAVLLSCVAFVTYDYFQHARMLRVELSNAANLAAQWSATAVSLGDRAAAARTLQALAADHRIVAAAMFSAADSSPLAEYHRAGNRTEGQSDLVIRDVMIGGTSIGKLAIRGDTRGLPSLLLRDISLAGLMVIGCTLLSFAATGRRRRMITEPIANLANLARSIPRGNEASMALPGESYSEVETVSETLRALVSRTEAQKSALQGYQSLLERQLAESAAALEISRAETAAADGRVQEFARRSDELLANMSHEIRTPMNVVVAMAQLALETNLTAEQRAYISSVSDSAGSLLKGVNHIIDFSQLEAGGLVLECKEFSISETLCDVIRSFSPAARSKGLSLVLESHDDVPSAVLGDQGKFRQIIVSLIDNALKFTDTGTVTVRVLPVFHSDTAAGLHLAVIDTGRGLGKEQFERAVTPFEKTPASSMRLRGGAGLGLAISNRLIGMLGGCLWLESEIGRGSTFHFTATFDITNSLIPTPTDFSILHGASVLIADRSSITRRFLQQVVSRWKMVPTLAASPAQAIELMQTAAAAGGPFDVALVDHDMVGADGSPLTREICELSERGNPVVTVLSSGAHLSAADLAGDFRPSGYLISPVTHASLLKTVLSAVQTARKRRESSSGPSSSRDHGKQAHILVAEDNALNQAVAVGILVKEGYKVSVARDGSEAIEAFERGGLDLILMDVEMPSMSGLEAVRLIRLKEADNGGHIAVLALTAHAMLGDRERCLDAGMDDYVSKPLHVPLLRTTVSRWLDLSSDLPSCKDEPVAVA